MKAPTLFGKYYLLERINVGGMAEVFQAKAFGVEGFERLLAVKRILPNIAEDKEFIEMFIDEAKIAVQLNHANIGQIFDLGRVGDAYFIALEYIHGKDLRAIFDRCRQAGQAMPIAQACFTIMKVCEGLDYAHNKRDSSGQELHLVHRDVSPQNILVSYEGEIKVIDFGIAKAAGKASKTQAGILKGKFGYMSPEQVRGLPIDRRSDIFSLGIVLYELLTAERLFVGESDFSTLEKVRNVEILPPSTYNRKIPDELERIVFKALAKDVEDRYQNAIDLHNDLQAFLYATAEYYSRKDLAEWMKKTFAGEIEQESRKLDEYRTLAPPEGQLRTPAPPQFSPASHTAPPLPSGTVPPRFHPAMTMPPPPPLDVQPPVLRSEPPYYGGQAALAVAPAGPSTGQLDWDEEELETQVFDKVDDVPAVELPPQREITGEVHLPSVPAQHFRPKTPPRGAPLPVQAPAGGSDLDWSGSVRASPLASRRAMPSSSPSLYAPRAAPPRKRSFLVYAGLVAAVFVLCLMSVLWYVRRSGTITITSFPSDVQVTVNGLPVAKETPVTLAKPPGVYKVIVQREGYATKEYDINLGAGERIPLHAGLVSLSAEVAFILKSDPPRQKAFLDGHELDGETPFKVRDVMPGRHKVEIKGGGCYAPWSQDFSVEIGKPPVELQARLKPLAVQAQIQSTPTGSKIYVLSDGRRTFYGETPKKLTFDPTKQYTLSIEHAGYKTRTEPLHFDGRCEVALEAVLEKSEEAPPPPPPKVASTPKPPKREKQPEPEEEEEAEPPKKPEVAAAKEAEAGSGEGFLKVNTRPWTKIAIDGEDTGLTTPQARIALSPGTHLLTLSNPQFGINKTQKVVIAAGETAAVIQKFQVDAQNETD